MDTHNERPMTTGEVSKYLRYTERTIVKLAQEGVLPGKKVGMEWRFVAHEIRSLIEKKK